MRFCLLFAQSETVETTAEAAAWGWQYVMDNNAIGIAITGMAIVFSALAFITLFISWMPKILAILDPLLPKVEHHPPAPAESFPKDEEKIVAAIGFVLHNEINRAARP